VSDAAIRAACGAAMRWCRARGVAEIGLRFAGVRGLGPDTVERRLENDLLLAAHRPPRIERDPKAGADVAIRILDGREPADAGRLARAKASAVALARDLAATPPNLLQPKDLAARAMAFCDDGRISGTCYGKDELREMGFGALLAVAAGSAAEPAFVHLRYGRRAATQERRPIVLVGKSVTFDTGGISLKPALDMDRQKSDMAGGAAVLGALKAALELDLDLDLDVLLPIVENMPGPGATRPGDVVRSHSGRTIEILNTDAEGRLILADALSFARGLAADCVIDLATLTGATSIVFGPLGIGTFVSDEGLWNELAEADRHARERLWRLPLWPEYRGLMSSRTADIANISRTVQKGSTMTAAAFLHSFIPDVPWAHLDIYNSAWSEDDDPLFGVGPTGAGAATLVEFLHARSRGERP
jgi:leucyl aminopeptidase